MTEFRPPDQQFTIRPALAEESARCQQIAVAAWAPIYASARQMLGDAIFAHLHSRWQERKAGQIAAHFQRHPQCVIVACTALGLDAAAPKGSSHGVSHREHREHAAEVQAERAAGDQPGAVAGFATFRLDLEARVGEIGNNAVDPVWQGYGIATALYERVLDLFRAQGLLLARVTTGLDDAHAPARAAYRKAGFHAAVPSVTLYREL